MHETGGNSKKKIGGGGMRHIRSVYSWYDTNASIIANTSRNNVYKQPFKPAYKT